MYWLTGVIKLHGPNIGVHWFVARMFWVREVRIFRQQSLFLRWMQASPLFYKFFFVKVLGPLTLPFVEIINLVKVIDHFVTIVEHAPCSRHRLEVMDGVGINFNCHLLGKNHVKAVEQSWKRTIQLHGTAAEFIRRQMAGLPVGPGLGMNLHKGARHHEGQVGGANVRINTDQSESELESKRSMRLRTKPCKRSWTLKCPCWAAQMWQERSVSSNTWIPLAPSNWRSTCDTILAWTQWNTA